ncbi:YeeE/YedE family protein [Xanthomonas nasturtii]|uniref:YeeE/YedE family protein n=1 Tax=Xanthomonas nasturtii TaxID=1843581 RepID=A0A3E1KSA5_9XANT|nr:YeeE/YedE thiosulfate transporter family protein [Xanthomonas nasturtii]MCL1500488.1 YeeE/YedE family protein [Xanthomonas nasturtii]MCL1504312.1 YeeE/YedE family protein [Xanthomonas nasturtii]MCL1523613.1 YeeE/YedE family protein [Xanthomonas nasturtii]MCL1531117.1 YeeE/YedE family protein [Xanthomonas nasturtii]MCL1560554.1 YeeE/YedE family protein [Xanthomonas nasturtii]
MTLPHLAWYWPVIGGLMIGTASGAYLLLVGRIAGISGMLADALGLQANGARSLSFLFLAGLLTSAGVALAIKPIPLVPLTGTSMPVLILAGVLVGYGTRLGAGCSSGHGVSGLARLSPRSIVATTVFVLLGMATVTVVRMVAGAGA